MKRENLQRANELEKKITELEHRLKMSDGSPYVTIGQNHPSDTFAAVAIASKNTSSEFGQDAFAFVLKVREKWISERQSLLKEMEEL